MTSKQIQKREDEIYYRVYQGQCHHPENRIREFTDEEKRELKELSCRRIINSNILKILFPSDFALPELQKIYESVLNIKIDRRNFRKKLINLGYIIPTGELNEGYTGRPAKLYRFNEEKEERNLF